MTTRRRFLITAAAAFATAGNARAAAPYLWQGTALGARATIRLTHPDAAAITTDAAAEIARLEAIFSLYRSTSALSRLNATGQLTAPPFELLECLTLCGSVHAATGGRFDPTVQRLWQAHAIAASENRALTAAERSRALALTGWHGVTLAEGAITLRSGMALTLNGIAQGYIADRIAALLQARGLTGILIDTGELCALGHRPDGQPWPVTLAPSGREIGLAARALATSAPLGTVFDTGSDTASDTGSDTAGRLGHILDPATGHPAPATWQAVSVSSPSAALADALSTAACLMPSRDAITAALARFPRTRLEAALPA